MKSFDRSIQSLSTVVGRFMGEMHRHDAGRTVRLMHATKVGMPQLAALELVRQPSTVSAIAAHIGLSRPATSQLIDKLVKKGLVGRSEGPTDRRERRVLITKKGEALLDRVRTARMARFTASLEVLAPALRDRLRRTLCEVVEAMEQTRALRP
jgi:DNA-binding MarR family transcriptional regulator